MSAVFRLSKLAKRLSLLKAALVGIVALSSCSSDAADFESAFQLDPSSVATITVDPSTDSGPIGRKVQFSATLKNAAGTVIGSRTVSWSTADGAVARSDAGGMVTYVGAGRTTVIASSGGKEQRVEVAVTAAAVGAVRITPTVASVATGMTAPLIATALAESGDSLPDRQVTWSSSRPGIARIDADGIVTALAPGTTTITASAESRTATALLSVTNVRIATLSISPTGVTIPQGSTVPLSAVSRDSASNSLADRPTAWSSRDTSVATITPTGMVLGRNPGSTLIVATAEGRTDEVTVVVTGVAVGAVRVNPESASVLALSSLQLTAQPEDDGGNALSGRNVEWTSSDNDVAIVGSDGLVSGVAAGTATITASSDGKSGTAKLTVTQPALVSGGFFAARVAPAAATAARSDRGILRPRWPAGTAASTRATPSGFGTGPIAGRSSVPSGASRVLRWSSTIIRGERPIIDGAGTSGGSSTFHVRGEWTVVWGLEVTNSDPDRTTSSTSNSVRPNGVVNYASNTRYVNLVVHDAGVAFFNDPEYHDVEISGCIMYNNGWQGPDRGHGHALYLKTNTGPLLARDNVVFNQFGYGVHAYASSGGGELRNIRVEGNVAFNNGTLASNSESANILLGGEEYATGDVVRDNFTYFSPGVTGINVQIGHASQENGDVTVRNNTMVGGSPVLKFGYWDQATFTDNTVIGKSQLVYLSGGSARGFSWSATRYYGDPLQPSWSFDGTSQSWQSWRKATGLGGSDQIGGAVPSQRGCSSGPIRMNEAAVM